MRQPTKAIILAAGFGTRFLPACKSIPKEMFPVIDKPVIQLIAEQAVASGVKDIIIVTSSRKHAIEDHFDHDETLDKQLRETGKNELADELKGIADMANFIYIRQKGTPKGTARPILNCKHLIDDDEPFYVFFADDFYVTKKTPWPAQLCDAYNKTGKTVISMMEIDKRDADKYAIAVFGEKINDRVFQIEELIEKPGAENAKSNFASISGFLLTPDILPILEKIPVSKSGEIYLADGLNELAKKDKIYGCFVDGTRYDTGDKLLYVEAIVDLALNNPKYHDDLVNFLKNKLG